MILCEDLVKRGVIPTNHQEDIELLKKTLEAGFLRVFANDLNNTTVFAYRRCEQSNEFFKYEGHAQDYYLAEGGKGYAIGVSVEGLNAGEEYSTDILIHELSHVLTDRQGFGISEHNKEFKKNYREAVRKYEQETGKNLSTWDCSGKRVAQIKR